VPWFKVDDQLATHPKVARAGLAAMGLWVKAGSWSARHLTDGHIPTEMLAVFGARRHHAEALVKAGLWHEDMDGWRFKDWAEYQPSAADTRLYQEEASDAGARGNHYRWHKKRGIKNPDCPFCNGELK
jgi:hypothetical protein